MVHTVAGSLGLRVKRQRISHMWTGCLFYTRESVSP